MKKLKKVSVRLNLLYLLKFKPMQQQDQQLINSLLEQQNSSAYAQQSAQDSSDSQISISRVVTAKYKVYVIILLILSVILGTKFLPRAWSDFQKSQENFEQKQTKIQQLDTQIQEYKTKKTVWKAITSTKEQIIGCVNDATNCEKLPPALRSQLRMITAYLQLGDLNAPKMQVDEKKILRNLDQFLTKNDPSEASSLKNGKVEAIKIGDPKLADEKSGFYQLPIELKMTFENKDDLISFVDNIEQYIIPSENDRILYHIDQVSYDMMAYDEEQTIEIKLSAYYFK
jgi:hypothetical protein